jgi:CTP:molybdopterin cytidylyltransferase MocA
MWRAMTGWLEKYSAASSQDKVEDVGDVLALEGDVEGVTVVTGALAHFARHVDVGQEVHLDLDGPVAGARRRNALPPR